MKRIWIALVSLAVVIMMGAYWCYYINQSVDELRRETEQVLQLMDEAPEQAKEPLERISGKWEQKEKTMDYIVLYDHIDEAKTALSKCRQYYTQQEIHPGPDRTVFIFRYFRRNRREGAAKYRKYIIILAKWKKIW